jgi:hypothetical protein
MTSNAIPEQVNRELTASHKYTLQRDTEAFNIITAGCAVQFVEGEASNLAFKVSQAARYE